MRCSLCWCATVLACCCAAGGVCKGEGRASFGRQLHTRHGGRLRNVVSPSLRSMSIRTEVALPCRPRQQPPQLRPRKTPPAAAQTALGRPRYAAHSPTPPSATWRRAARTPWSDSPDRSASAPAPRSSRSWSAPGFHGRTLSARPGATGRQFPSTYSGGAFPLIGKGSS